MYPWALKSICTHIYMLTHTHVYACAWLPCCVCLHHPLATGGCSCLLKGPCQQLYPPSAEGLRYVLRGPIWRPRSLLGRKTPQSPLIQGLQAIAQSEGKRLQTTGKQGERKWGQCPCGFCPGSWLPSVRIRGQWSPECPSCTVEAWTPCPSVTSSQPSIQQAALGSGGMSEGPWRPCALQTGFHQLQRQQAVGRGAPGSHHPHI